MNNSPLPRQSDRYAAELADRARLLIDELARTIEAFEAASAEPELAPAAAVVAPIMLTVEQAAEALALSRTLVYSLIK